MKKVAYFTLLMFSLVLISCDPAEETEPIDEPTEGMVEVDLVDLYGIKMIRLWKT